MARNRSEKAYELSPVPREGAATEAASLKNKAMTVAYIRVERLFTVFLLEHTFH